MYQERIMEKNYCIAPSSLEPVAKECGMKPEIAADIISMVVNLRTNAEILEYLRQEHGIKGKGHTLVRSINPLIKSFILQHYPDDFAVFCRSAKVSLFNEDLDSQKRNASHARMMCVVFLREKLRSAAIA